MRHIDDLRFGGGEDDEYGDPTSLTPAEVFADLNAESPEDAAIENAMCAEVQAMLDRVGGTEATLLRRLYGIGDIVGTELEPMTLTEAAAECTVTEQDAARMLASAMYQLRDPDYLEALKDFRETDPELRKQVATLSGLFHGLLREELSGFKRLAGEEARVDQSIEVMLAKVPYIPWRAVHAEALWNGHIDQIMSAYEAAARPSSSLSRENAAIRLYNRLLNRLVTRDDEIDLLVPAHFPAPPDHFLAGVRAGTIHVHGDVGDAFAEGAGGDGLKIYLDGDAGDWAGNGLADGTLLAINGNAGRCAGANEKGVSTEVFVRGDVHGGAAFRSTPGHLHIDHEQNSEL